MPNTVGGSKNVKKRKSSENHKEVPKKLKHEEDKPNAAADPVKLSGQITLENAENELQCSICSELFVKAVTLNCSHSFCTYCINVWKKQKKDCPICRKKITRVNPTLVLDNFVAKIVENSDENAKQYRKDIVDQREKPKKNKQTVPPKKRSRGSQLPRTVTSETYPILHMDSDVESILDTSEDEDDDERELFNLLLLSMMM